MKKALQLFQIAFLFTGMIIPERAWAQSQSCTITTVAGSGIEGFSGDGGPATRAEMNLQSGDGIAVDRQGNIYFCDADNFRVRKVSTDGIITTVAGTGVAGSSGDGGPASLAQLRAPSDVALDSAGRLYIVEEGGDRIRVVDTNNIITTYAGTGRRGFSGDSGPAHQAQFFAPSDSAFDRFGNLYVADAYNGRVRKIDTNGVITTLAGNGRSGFSGDLRLGTFASFSLPDGVAVDGAGNVYIADKQNHRVRIVFTNGVINTYAGNGNAGMPLDGYRATQVPLSYPDGLATDRFGNLYIASQFNHKIHKVDPNGIITTVAGIGSAGFSGDGGSPLQAQLDSPSEVTVDHYGNLYIADTGNERIRKVSCRSSSGSSDPPIVTATLITPRVEVKPGIFTALPTDTPPHSIEEEIKGDDAASDEVLPEQESEPSDSATTPPSSEEEVQVEANAAGLESTSAAASFNDELSNEMSMEAGSCSLMAAQQGKQSYTPLLIVIAMGLLFIARRQCAEQRKQHYLRLCR